MATKLTWLDALLFGYRRIVNSLGVEMPDRPVLKVTGIATVTDDPANNQTILEIGEEGAIYVPVTRQIIAGSGLGSNPAAPADLTDDITLFVSVINDAQHGQRGGGNLHAVATTGAAGFMSADDKTKLDGIQEGAQAVTYGAIQTACATADSALDLNGQTCSGGDPVDDDDFATKGWVLANPAGIASIGVTAPITSTGGASPTIGIDVATSSSAGSMSSEHYNRVNKRLGSNPTNQATGGGLNLANTESIRSRDAANNANASLLALDGSDVEVLGDDSVVASHETRAKTGGLWKWLVNNVLIAKFNATSLLFGETVTPVISADKRSGTGANAGSTMTVKAQDGQDVAAGSNNNGGKLALSSGGAGTGGSGGTPGDVALQIGSTDVLTVKGDGTGVVVDDDIFAKRHGSPPVSTTITTLNQNFTLDQSASQNYEFLLTKDVIFTLTNARAGTTFRVQVDQNASGDNDVTWPASFAFATGDNLVDTIPLHRTIWGFYIDSSLRVSCEYRKTLTPP